MTKRNDTRAVRRDLLRFRYIVVLAAFGLCLSVWMLQTAYDQHTRVLRIGDQTAERLQMRGLIDQEGARYEQR
jgi:uroporphyrinogen-III synthase